MKQPVRLETRLGSGYAAMIVAMILSLAIIFVTFEKVRDDAIFVRKHLGPSIQTTSDMLLALEQMENAEFLYPRDLTRWSQHFDRWAKRFDEGFVRARGLMKSEQSRLEEIEQSYRNFLLTDGRMRALIRTGRIKEAEDLNLSVSLQEAGLLRERIRHFRQSNLEQIAREEGSIQRALLDAERWLLLLTFLGALLGGALWWQNSRTLVGPLVELHQVTRGIAEGRYGEAHHPDARRILELEALQRDFNRMAAQLREKTGALERVNETLESQVADRTRELQEANEKLASMLEETRKVERLKSDLLAVMSHELLTPINFIVAYGSTLEEGVLGELNAEQRKALERLMEGARRLTRMVRNVLDYAQLASGQLALAPETVDLTELVRTSVEAERAQWMKKGLHLDLMLPERAVPAWGDPARIEQVLGEILDNAIKFTPEGGKIRVSLSSEGDRATVEIKDNGAGIPPEALPHLYEPFYQFDLTSTRQFGGMGLGLAIVRHLIEGMGGSLSIQSSLGRGTTVRFTLKNMGIIS